MVRTFDRDRHGRGMAGTLGVVGEGRGHAAGEDAAPGGRQAAAQVLRDLLRGDGVTLTFEQATMHLGEDGMSCTRAEYEACWERLHGGEDMRGRRRRPPGAAAEAQGAAQPEPGPDDGPAESEATVSEGNGTAHAEAPALNRLEGGRRLRGLIREMGPGASLGEIRQRAQGEGLPCANPTIHAARKQVWGLRRGRGAAPEDAKPARARAPAAPGPAPKPPPPPATDPAPAGGLALAVELQRQLAELRQKVEAAGGTLRYRLTLSVDEEG